MSERTKSDQIAAIQRATAQAFDIPLSRLLCKKRCRAWAHPRQVAMYLAYTCTDASLPFVAARFHRHHTTVLHAIDKIGAMKNDPEIMRAVRRVELNLLRGA